MGSIRRNVQHIALKPQRESTNAISSGEYNLNELYLDYVDPDILGGCDINFPGGGDAVPKTAMHRLL